MVIIIRGIRMNVLYKKKCIIKSIQHGMEPFSLYSINFIYFYLLGQTEREIVYWKGVASLFADGFLTKKLQNCIKNEVK